MELLGHRHQRPRGSPGDGGAVVGVGGTADRPRSRRRPQSCGVRASSAAQRGQLGLGRRGRSRPARPRRADPSRSPRAPGRRRRRGEPRSASAHALAPRLEDPEVGDDGGDRTRPPTVRKSSSETNVRRLWRSITNTSFAEVAISGAPPRARQAHLRVCRTAPITVLFRFAMPVDLRRAEEADVDAAGLEPVGEDLGHRDHRVGGLRELAVADREREPRRLGADRAALVDRARVRGARPPRQVGRLGGKADARRSTPSRRAGAARPRRPSSRRR